MKNPKHILNDKTRYSLGILIKRILYQEFYRSYILFSIQLFIRKNFKKTEIDKIKKIKNTANKKRCFIIGTGPSLTINDLELLRNEDTFSCNSIVLCYDKTTWRPTYYGIIDKIAYSKFKESIKFEEYKNIFYCYDQLRKFKIEGTSLLIDYRHHLRERFFKKYSFRFHDDISDYVGDGNTVVIMLIQIAIYMGYKEIILLGTDCNYLNNSGKHFIDFPNMTNSFDGYKMIAAHEEMEKFAAKKGVKIYNATRGGMLDIYERIKIEDILERN